MSSGPGMSGLKRIQNLKGTKLQNLAVGNGGTGISSSVSTPLVVDENKAHVPISKGPAGTKRCYPSEPNSMSVNEHEVSIDPSIEKSIGKKSCTRLHSHQSNELAKKMNSERSSVGRKLTLSDNEAAEQRWGMLLEKMQHSLPPAKNRSRAVALVTAAIDMHRTTQTTAEPKDPTINSATTRSRTVALAQKSTLAPTQTNSVEHAQKSTLAPAQSTKAPTQESVVAPSQSIETSAQKSIIAPKLKRAVRGVARGESLEKFVDQHGKYKISFPPGEAVSVSNDEQLSSGIGVIVRGHADIGKTISGWEDVTNLSKDFCYARLGHLFDIEECDTLRVQHIIDKKFRRAYTSWKYSLHTSYNSLVNKGISPRSVSPRKDVTLEKWQLACDFIEDDKYQKRSRVNIENRDKMLFNQKTGRTPFLRRFKNMDEKSEIEFFKSAHVENSVVRLKYDEMVDLKNKVAENGESVIESDIVKSTLGHKSGYIKGMGHGLQVFRGITSSLITGISIKEKLTELDKANEQIVHLTNKCEEQTNVVNSMKTQMSKWQKIIEMIPGVSQVLIDGNVDEDEAI